MEQTSPRNTAKYQVLEDRADRLIVALPNRMVVVAQELPTAPVASTQVWVKTGSIYEQEHAGAGLSHFLEHLASGGTTENRSESDSNALLGRIGAKTNAGTSLATVRYYINTSSTHVKDAIDLLSDWMQHSQIRPDEFVRERDVIQREFQMGQGDPGRILWKLTQKARYAYHPARHPTIGYLSDFLAIRRDELFAFYKQMYVPNNMVFVVVGKIDRRKIVQQVADLWREIPPRKLPEISFPVEAPALTTKELAGVADIRSPRLRLAWPGTRLAEEGDYALDLLAVILGQGESSRLVRHVRDEQQLANTISAFNLSMSWGEGFFAVDAEIARNEGLPTERAVVEVKKAILEQVDRVRKFGVTQEELQRAQRKVRARQVYGTQTAEGLAAELGEHLISMQDPDYAEQYAKAVQAVTADEIRSVARRVLIDRRLTCITLQPLPDGTEPEILIRPEEPDAPDTIGWENVELDNARIIAAMAGRGDRRTSDPIFAQPTRRVVLPNGLRLLIGINNAVPAVSIQFYHLGGLLADEPGREGVANATWQMLMRGTESMSAHEIAERVDNLGASLATSCGYNTHYAQALCLRDDWPTMLELLAEVILNPAFPSEEWERMQPRLLASIDRIADRWTGELGTRFRRAYFGSGHTWSQPVLGRRGVVGSLKTEELHAFHHDHLAASESVLAVFGDVDPAAVEELADRLFGRMRDDAPDQFVPPPAAPVETGLQIFETAKQLAAVQVGFGPGATRRSEDYPALRVLANVISDFPSGWLNQALRGREGLVYAAWAYAYTGLSPGYFTVVFNTKPETIDAALARTMQVMNRARQEVVDSQSLLRAKAGVLTSEFFGRQSNADRGQEAALNELYGMGLDEPDRFLARVDRLTAADLRDVARKYLRHPVGIVISHPIPMAEEQITLQGLLRDFGSAESGERQREP